MSGNKLTRRDFLKFSAMSAVAVTLASCAQPEPAAQPTTAPTQPTAAPAQPTAAPAQPTAAPVVKFKEAPALAELVKAGKLPPVEERLPEEPLVVKVVEEIGQYGGTWRRVGANPTDMVLDSRLSYCNLVRYTDMAAEIVPHVALKWEVNSDNSEYTFYLRKGMKYSDGVPFTTEHIMFWYEDRLMNKELTPSVSSWLKINNQPVVVEKVDDYAFKMKFAGSYGLFMAINASPDGQFINNAAKHYLVKFHPKYAKKEDLDKILAEAKQENWFTHYGTMDRWQNPDRPSLWAWNITVPPPTVPVIAERNPYYFAVDPEGNQLPYVDRIRWDIVENADMVNLKAVAGEIDMQFRHIAWTNYPLLLDSAAKGGYRVMKWILAEGSNYLLHPNMNHQDKGMRQLMETKDFRHALSVAINRSEINEVAYQGMGTPRQSSVLETVKYFKPSQAEAYAQYDPALANKLLDGIGMTARDEEGMRKRLDGQKLTINIEYTPLFGPWRDCTQMICKYWGDVGIRAVPKEEARELFSQRADAGLEQDMSVWTMDRSAHPLVQPLYQMPRRTGTPPSTAALYWDYYTSAGEKGEKPPAEIQKAYDLYDACKTAKNDEELTKFATELLDLNAEETWFIGVVGLLPAVGVVNSKLRNVPETSVYDWLALGPGNTYPEQYFFKS